MAELAMVRTHVEQRLNKLTTRAAGDDDALSRRGDEDWEENAGEAEDDTVVEQTGDLAVGEIRQIKLALSQFVNTAHKI